MFTRLLYYFVCALLIGLLSVPSWAAALQQKRIGGSPVFSSAFASPASSQVAESHQENSPDAYDFASGVHKYLYCHANPVNGWDPSGREFTLTGTLSAGTIGAAIGMWSTIAANDALGRAQTYSSILMGGSLGAILGPLSAEYALFGVGVGAVSVASSGTLVWDVFKNPNSTYSQKVEASALLVASIAGTAVGVKYARIAKTPAAEQASSLPTTKRLFRCITENEVKQIREGAGGFEFPENGSTPDGLPGKWFYGTRAEAEAFAALPENVGKNPTIVATEVTQSSIAKIAPGIDGNKTGYFVHMEDLISQIKWLPYP